MTVQLKMFLFYLCLLVFVNLCIDRSVKRRTSNAMVQKETLSIFGGHSLNIPSSNCKEELSLNHGKFGKIRLRPFISVTEVASQ